MFSGFRSFGDDFTVLLNFSGVPRVFRIGDFSVFGTLVHYPWPGAVHVDQLVVGLFESFAYVSLALHSFFVGLHRRDHKTM